MERKKGPLRLTARLGVPLQENKSHKHKCFCGVKHNQNNLTPLRIYYYTHNKTHTE